MESVFVPFFYGGITVITETSKQDAVALLLASIKNYTLNPFGWDARTSRYVYTSAFCPSEQLPVGAVLEPVIRTSDWNLGEDGMLTVNSRGCLILNSRNLLTLDMDHGDRRYDKWAVRDTQQVVHYLHDLAALDADRARGQVIVEGQKPEPLPFLWSQQTWKVYSTQGGTRVICTSMPFPLNTRDNVHEFLTLSRFLGVDPIYAEKCCEQQCYRARLSPKYNGDEPVCSHVATSWKDTAPHPDVAEQLGLHDDFTSFQWALASIPYTCEV